MIAPLEEPHFLKPARFSAPHPKRILKMKKLLIVTLTLLLTASFAWAGQNSNSSTSSGNKTSSNSNRKRGPIFRATKDQVNQAQSILKERRFYSGDQTGKLDTATRDGLRKFQEAENLQVTGTLNKITLEKMGIPLTEKQKTM
jgi:peptidoglycan hydrolase-like protein with peptidoglycan-binding domain